MVVRLLHYSDVENAYDEPERIGRLVGLIDDLRDDATIVAGTGDNTAPGVLSLVTRGRQALDFFHAVEPDVETFGNHDFDYGPSTTRALVRDSPQTWVSANVRSNGAAFGTDVGVVPTTVLEVNETRIGFFGVTDPRTPAINPAAVELSVVDPYEAAERAVESLRSRGVDHLVALSHLGSDDDVLARRVDVDVILGGHVHTPRIDRVDGTVLTRPGANGVALMEVTLGEEVDVQRRPATAAAPSEPVVTALRDRLSGSGLHEVVARVETPIERNGVTAFGGESRIGNWVADAYRWYAGTDVALQNGGGIRAGRPLHGDVTVADCVSVVPFDEPLAIAELRGSELESVIAEARDPGVGFGESHWWHAHVGGMRVVWDERAGELRSVTVAGAPLDPDETYTIATSDYLLHTAYEFPTLTPDHRVRTLATGYEVLVAYARDRGIDPTVDGRLRLLGIETAGSKRNG